VRRGDDVLIEAKVKVAFVSGGRARPIPKALRIAMKPIRTWPEFRR
jgi:acyl-CoA thioester hydrolase